MKKQLIPVFIAAALTLTGCQLGAENQDLYEENGNTINVTDRSELYNEDGIKNGTDDMDNHFGYVRHQKSPIKGYEKLSTQTPEIDREQIANIISSLSVQLPNVNDVATLVTDDEVLVGYVTDSKNRLETADQVKKTAISVVPRYFHIYVTDNPNLIKQIESYSQMDTNALRADRSLDTIIKEMLKSPQGRPLNSGENANGEGYKEMNEKIDKDMKDRR
ncbi:YhcN/YlaJ family sporulation lipoprotein [Bacillus sp. FJAT-47783]|uniref:YhcN/YlaJ family sporulation lipoprotein n=1 Tax=Bacillus sp. FJAT-47783 TaxID=2922712 RepID=UPI001FAE3C07|nr:YhcN/YlaJ family sporulation lipoprotein [Bacillus sp. FJAT-47783]